MPLGEASVAVVAVSPHRDAAFAAARYAIDETKARAPIWKAERFADGHVWVGEPARTGPADGNGSQEDPRVKVYISVDMEGVAGVSHPKPTSRGDSGYPDAVGLMVGEANAAIEGAFDGGATEVVVNDSHGGMYNLRPADLDPRARVIQGQKAWSMVEGAGPDRGFDVALFVGYHARAGHPRGTIAHTYSGRPTRLAAERPARRRDRAQRHGARSLGRAGRARQRRRRAGRGGRRVAAVGGAGRRQGRGRRQQRRVVASERGGGADPRRRRRRPSSARRPASSGRSRSTPRS